MNSFDDSNFVDVLSKKFFCDLSRRKNYLKLVLF